MNKDYFFLLLVLFLSLGCITAPSTKSGLTFLPSEWKPADEVLCEGSGLRFGSCIAREMSDSTCIGIAKFNGSYIAVQIPCTEMFKSALDTISLE